MSMGYCMTMNTEIDFQRFKKSLPRIPLVDDVKDFWSFSKAGRALADLYINYEKFRLTRV